MDWGEAAGIQIVVPEPDQAVTVQLWKKENKTQHKKKAK